ncbi:hypothetical protein B0H19DRAFT_1370332 [Mycena capillaripes]|nr:hypothetical protein B0H19DRAFT_1370332 [Mycena capillaripes]
MASSRCLPLSKSDTMLLLPHCMDPTHPLLSPVVGGGAQLSSVQLESTYRTAANDALAWTMPHLRLLYRSLTSLFIVYIPSLLILLPTFVLSLPNLSLLLFLHILTSSQGILPACASHLHLEQQEGNRLAHHLLPSLHAPLAYAHPSSFTPPSPATLTGTPRAMRREPTYRLHIAPLYCAPATSLQTHYMVSDAVPHPHARHHASAYLRPVPRH